MYFIALSEILYTASILPPIHGNKKLIYFKIIVYGALLDFICVCL